jgi:hypothetical protein
VALLASWILTLVECPDLPPVMLGPEVVHVAGDSSWRGGPASGCGYNARRRDQEYEAGESGTDESIRV